MPPMSTNWQHRYQLRTVHVRQLKGFLLDRNRLLRQPRKSLVINFRCTGIGLICLFAKIHDFRKLELQYLALSVRDHLIFLVLNTR